MMHKLLVLQCLSTKWQKGGWVHHRITTGHVLRPKAITNGVLWGFHALKAESKSEEIPPIKIWSWVSWLRITS
jgi:hypothetical protein